MAGVAFWHMQARVAVRRLPSVSRFYAVFAVFAAFAAAYFFAA